ncbi:MAG: glycosyltransferase family 4 protein [Candidatus Nomurabacteria bacterium]
MKILYLITKSNWGGAQRYVYDLAVAFKSKGCNPIVAFGGHGLLEENLNKANIKTVSLNSLIRDISLTKEIFVVKEIYSLIKKEKPDIVHLNSSKASGVGALIARILGVKNIIVTIHGAPFREDRNIILKKIIYFLTWVTCLLSHTVITVSKQDEADIGTMFFIKKKLKTIYLGLTYDPPLTRITPKSKVVRIITVGDLTKNKGHLFALHAIEKLRDNNVPFHYTIVGEGEERKSLEEFIAFKNLGEFVDLLGYQDARSILHEYDLYLLSSVKEGLPYILLEAGKAMLPVVATITGGVPEIIRHEETGLLVQPKDVDSLTKELKRLISDRKIGKKLGQGLHAHIVQNFSHSKMLVETAKVYGLIKSKK